MRMFEKVRRAGTGNKLSRAWLGASLLLFMAAVCLMSIEAADPVANQWGLAASLAMWVDLLVWQWYDSHPRGYRISAGAGRGHPCIPRGIGSFLEVEVRRTGARNKLSYQTERKAPGFSHGDISDWQK